MYLNEVTLISNTATANVELGTLFLARVDVRHYALERSHTIVIIAEKGNEGERTSNWPLETCGPWLVSLAKGSPTLMALTFSVKLARNLS